MALTVRKIDRLKKPGRYGDGKGLVLQVARGGTKSWVFRFERNGKEHMMGLGPAHTIGLAEARERARQARLLLLDGINPLDARMQARAQRALAAANSKTFDACVADYLAKHSKSWKNAKHRAQWENTLATYAGPVLGSLPVATISRADVLRVLSPIWHEKTATAGRLRGRIESVLEWAKANGYREGDNPAAWATLKHDLAAPTRIATTKHHAAVSFAELPAFYAALAERPGIAAKALAFTILTAARTSEVLGATWAEIDSGAGIWDVPKERMKMGRPHRVPLAPPARAILADLPREDGNPFVFIGPHKGRGLSNGGMSAVLRRMGRQETIHGFRASFKTWASDATGFPPHIVEAALAHINQDKVESAYNRGDLFKKRQKLMDAWANFCTTPVAVSNVVPLKAKATA